MPITEEQRIERRKGIWASDVPKIVGVDPYGSAYDVWLEKTGKLPDEQRSNDAADAGTRFEPAIVSWAEEKLGPLERDVEIFDTDLGIGAHLDAQVLKDDRVVEAKTSGLFGPLKEEWGEDRSDDVPKRVIVQTQIQMLVAKTDIAYVPAFLGGRGLSMFEIPFDKELAGILAERVMDFRENNVQADVPPDAEPSIENLYRRKRSLHKTTRIDPSLILEWELAQARVAGEKKTADYWKAEILKAIKDGDSGEWGNPEDWPEEKFSAMVQKCVEVGTKAWWDRVFTFLEQTRKEYVVKATTFRVPRIVKRQKGQ